MAIYITHDVNQFELYPFKIESFNEPVRLTPAFKQKNRLSADFHQVFGIYVDPLKNLELMRLLILRYVAITVSRTSC